MCGECSWEGKITNTPTLSKKCDCGNAKWIHVNNFLPIKLLDKLIFRCTKCDTLQDIQVIHQP